MDGPVIRPDHGQRRQGEIFEFVDCGVVVAVVVATVVAEHLKAKRPVRRRVGEGVDAGFALRPSRLGMTFVENRPGRVRQYVAVGRIVVVGTDDPPCLRRTDVWNVSVRFRKHAVGVDGRGRRKRVKHVHRCVQVCKNVTEDDAAHSGADAVVENPRTVIAAVPESGLRRTARGGSTLGEVGDSAVGVAAAIREIFDLAESQPVGCVACSHADADGPVGGHAVAVARERPLAAVRPSGLVAARVDDRP